MANIIYDEKRMVNIGEVCAIELKNIKPLHLVLESWDNVDTGIFFEKNNGISSENEITFIKYLGNGMFIDLVSDQLFITSTFSGDDIGTEEFYELDVKTQNQLEKIASQYCMLQAPKNIEDFKKTFSIFMTNPLVISIMSGAPFMSINSEIVKRFASQSIEQVKSKITSAKLTVQQEMQQEYSKLEEKIINLYTSKPSHNSR